LSPGASPRFLRTFDWSFSLTGLPEYYGGTPTRAPVIRWDGRHENDPEIGKSVPPEVVETSSFNLATTIVQEGKLLQPLDLKIVDFGQAFIYRPGQMFPYTIHTPGPYRAPEILVHNAVNLDNPFATDLWSAGCAIFYVATGTAPINSFGTNLLKAWVTALHETLPSGWMPK